MSLKITLTLLEGIYDECDQPVTATTFAQADAMLAFWFRLNCFENGKRVPGYCKSTIKAEGLPHIGSYELRYDIGDEKGDADGIPSLQRRLIEGMIYFAKILLEKSPQGDAVRKEFENPAGHAEALLNCVEYLRDSIYDEITESILGKVG